MWSWLLSLEQQRKRLHGKLPDSPLRRYYATPFPDRHAGVEALSYVSLDLETSGFDPLHDNILSIGRVEIRRGQIELGSAHYTLVEPYADIREESVVIHGITDEMSSGGQGFRRSLDDLLAALGGKVLLAHHARLELGFLNQACQRLYGGPFIAPTVDTLYLAIKRLERRQHSFAAGALRLYKLREEYGLPRYKAHNALNDALATAELFLAQMQEKGGAAKIKLKDIQLPRNA